MKLRIASRRSISIAGLLVVLMATIGAAQFQQTGQEADGLGGTGNGVSGRGGSGRSGAIPGDASRGPGGASRGPGGASRARGGASRGRGGAGRGRGASADRSDYPTWSVPTGYEEDVFTFVRVRYDSHGYSRPGREWDNDYPDCDWNFSARLQELTSMKVDPNGKVLRLTDPELEDYPFVFMSNIARMNLDEAETEALRNYLLCGGFMMADDFWAPQGWRNVYNEMKRVFPDREPRELSADHEIFHIVYELKGTPQVPSIFAWQQGHTFEYWHGDPEGDEGPHFWGFFDDSDRLMALLCHNNDIGDGWEREGEYPEYFRDYSVRVSYPLGINIVTYAMTH